MATGKLHLLGSSRTDGYLDNFDDQAKVVAWITGLTNDADILGNAITQFVASMGSTTHHTDTTLPLHSVHAVQIGPTKVKAVGYYRRRRWGGTPTGTFADIASFRVGQDDPVPWVQQPIKKTGLAAFNASGQPNGDILTRTGEWIDTDPIDLDRLKTAIQNKNVESYWWRPTVYRMYVPTVLTTSPMAASPSVFALMNYINSDTPTFNGYSFAAQTLKFIGQNEDWVDQNGTDTYIVEYAFSARPGGHVMQHLKLVNGVATLRTYPAYPQTTFANKFPSH